MQDTEFEPRAAHADPEEAEALWSRRNTMVGVAATAVLSAGMLGCKPCFSPVPPTPRQARKPGARTITVRLKIIDGKYRELRAILDDPALSPFAVPCRGIHYARLFTTDQSSLFFMVIYDRYEQSIRFLSDNYDGVDPILGLCEGYPPDGARDTDALNRYVWSNKICVELFYRAYDESQPVIRNALTLRESFLSFVRASEGLQGEALAAVYGALWNDPHLAFMLPMAMRQREGKDGELEVTSNELLRMDPVVSTEQVNPFTLLARVKPSQLRKVQRTLRLGTFATIDLGMRPLSDLPTLHFARVSIIHGDQMLFASVYDGDFIQYVEDFGTRIAKEIDAVFGACIGYPMAGSRDVAQFKDFLRSHQVQTNAFGGAYLNHTLLDIQSSLALKDALERLHRRVQPGDRRLRAKLDRFLHDNQLLLT